MVVLQNKLEQSNTLNRQIIDSDHDALMQVRAGNLGAFEIIMRRYNQRIYRIARGILKDDFEAEDIVQETYLKAFTALDRINDHSNFSAWLSKISVNESLMRLRKLQQTEISYTLRDTQDISQPGPEQLTENSQLHQILETAIDTLPDHFRLVFILRAVEQLSVDETAQSLELNTTTVKTRYHRAKNLLQQQFSDRTTLLLPNVFEFGGQRCSWMVIAVLTRIQRMTNLKN